MNLSAYITRNTLRTAQKSICLSPATAWTHSKANSASGENEPIVKIITRKKYKELPAVRKLPDGSDALALDEWLGGLEAYKKSLEGPLGVIPQHSSAP
jgi:hypothetical protein